MINRECGAYEEIGASCGAIHSMESDHIGAVAHLIFEWREIDDDRIAENRGVTPGEAFATICRAIPHQWRRFEERAYFRTIEISDESIIRPNR